MTFISALKAVGLLLVMAVPGFLIGKSKRLDADSAIKVLSVLLLYVCQPFVVVNSFLNTPFNKGILLNLVFICLIVAITIMVLLFLSGFLFNKLLKVPDGRGGIYTCSSALGNIGYMCIPFLQVISDDPEIILYAATAVVVFNLLSWTAGAYLITRDKRFISVKKAVLNPPTLTFLFVFILFICNINFVRFPVLSPAAELCKTFASLTAPFSMTILGLRFTTIKPKELFTDKYIYLTCFLKLIVSSFIGIGLYFFFGIFFDLSAIKLNVIALSAMPSATVNMMFCSIFEKDVGTAAKAVLLSSFLSIITIPLFMLFL